MDITMLESGNIAATSDEKPRILLMVGLSIVIAACSVVIAQALVGFINLVTNLVFHQEVSVAYNSPAENSLGLWVIVAPALGGIIVGLMARFGSQAIRGHGIPEAMIQILTNESRIPLRITFLKPLSAAVAIGTGGPFGAEGPIIATGGALGSAIGQFIKISAIERKTLLACGAAAGMTAIFGSPIAAVLLAIELLLFEFRARTFLPVAMGAVVAASLRAAFVGAEPIFPMATVATSTPVEIVWFLAEGFIMGLLAILVTKLVYKVEDGFEELPIHWMWWPALGGLVVGIVGYFVPRTLGVGYENIEDIITGAIPLQVLIVLTIAKFVSWVFALGSGTSGGTLAPLFTVGGGIGAVMAIYFNGIFPGETINVGLAGLVGMAAMFAGSSRALLASTIFAFETTQQPAVIVPLLAGCSASYLASFLKMRNTIMTEKIERRGIRVPSEYSADFLAQRMVRDAATTEIEMLEHSRSLKAVRDAMLTNDPSMLHQGYPVVDGEGNLLGLVTRKMVLNPVLTSETESSENIGSLVKRPAITVYEDQSLREATNLMIRFEIGRLVVVGRKNPKKALGILTRSDVFRAYRSYLDTTKAQAPKRKLPWRGQRLRDSRSRSS